MLPSANGNGSSPQASNYSLSDASSLCNVATVQPSGHPTLSDAPLVRLLPFNDIGLSPYVGHGDVWRNGQQVHSHAASNTPIDPWTTPLPFPPVNRVFLPPHSFVPPAAPLAIPQRIEARELPHVLHSPVSPDSGHCRGNGYICHHSPQLPLPASPHFIPGLAPSAGNIDPFSGALSPPLSTDQLHTFDGRYRARTPSLSLDCVSSPPRRRLLSVDCASPTRVPTAASLGCDDASARFSPSHLADRSPTRSGFSESSGEEPYHTSPFANPGGPARHFRACHPDLLDTPPAETFISHPSPTVLRGTVAARHDQMCTTSSLPRDAAGPCLPSGRENTGAPVSIQLFENVLAQQHPSSSMGGSFSLPDFVSLYATPPRASPQAASDRVLPDNDAAASPPMTRDAVGSVIETASPRRASVGTTDACSSHLSGDNRVLIAAAAMYPADGSTCKIASRASADPASCLAGTTPDVLPCHWGRCLSIFSTQAELAKHLEVAHVPPKSSPLHCLWNGCAQYGKPVKKRGRLILHLRNHSGERPHECKFCGKGFARLEALRLHLHSHTGERPYPCLLASCGRLFSNGTDRNRHQRTHDEAKPYVCKMPTCGKRYTDPGSLRKHARLKGHRVSDIESLACIAIAAAMESPPELESES